MTRPRRTPFRLTDRDVERLNGLAGSLGGRRRHGGVQQAIADWEKLIDDVRKGYWGNAGDYVRELEVRDYLERSLVGLEGHLHERLSRVLQDLDVAFLEVTRDDERGRVREFHREGTAWWWRRVPVKPGRLANDLLR